MRFLVKFTASLQPIVPYEAEARKAAMGVRAWLENQRVKADYTLVGTRDSFSIWEGESVEQLHFDIMANPSHRLGDWEITPIIDNREGRGWEKRAGVKLEAQFRDASIQLSAIAMSDAACQSGLA